MIRICRDGQRLSDNEKRSAVGIVGDVRVQATLRGSRIITEALMTECAEPLPRPNRAPAGRHYWRMLTRTRFGAKPLALSVMVVRNGIPAD